MVILLFFWDIEQKYLGVVQWKSRRGCQKWILIFRGNFRRKMFFYAKFTICYFFWKSSRKISAGCPKKISGAFNLLSSSPWEQFVESIFRKFLHTLWTFFRIFSGNWVGKGRPVKAAFFVSIETFGKKNVSENKWIFVSFIDSEQEVFGFLSNFLTVTAFYVSKVKY